MMRLTAANSVLEREVREIAGDDNVIDVSRPKGAGEGAHVFAPMHGLPLEPKVCVPCNSLVEEA